MNGDMSGPSQVAGPSGSSGPSTQQYAPPPGLPPNAQASTSNGAGPSYDARPSPPLHVTPGAPSFPPGTQTNEPDAMSPTSPRRDRPPAEKDVFLRATEKTPLWSTHYIDPTLRNQTIRIPDQVTNIANIALAGLASGPKTRYNQTIGAPIDGLAKQAKEWFIAPDGRFVSQDGGIEVGMAVVDSGGKDWGKDKGRKKARIEVESRHGGDQGGRGECTLG